MAREWQLWIGERNYMEEEVHACMDLDKHLLQLAEDW